MRSADDIKKTIRNLSATADPETHQRVLDDLLKVMAKTQKQPSAYQPTWRIIMKNKITKLAAAAVIVFAAFISIHFYGSSIDGANVAWADVTRRFNNVDYVHFYMVKSAENDFPTIREGWYAHGKLRNRSCGGFSSYGAYQTFDDSQTWRVFDRHNNITCVGESYLGKYSTIFEALTEAITYGLVPFDFSQSQDKTPVSVASDFLIYDFEPSEEADWIEKISVTVGRNSLMPMQIKAYYKSEKWYCESDLLLFDYEEPEKPVEFFELPTETKPPHGIGQVVLGGDEVEIDLYDAPGIKKAIVRLHTRFDGPAEDLLVGLRERYKIVGGPVYFMEITFIIDEGYKSITSKKCPLWLDQGVKAALGNKDNWPDDKYRNIRYTPVLRATDKENVFLLELSCWLRTKNM